MMFTFIIFAITYLLFIGYAMTAPSILEKKYMRCNADNTQVLPEELKEECVLDMKEYKANTTKLALITAASGILMIVSLFL
jgi:hypothetical protein